MCPLGRPQVAELDALRKRGAKMVGETVEREAKEAADKQAAAREAAAAEPPTPPTAMPTATPPPPPSGADDGGWSEMEADFGGGGSSDGADGMTIHEVRAHDVCVASGYRLPFATAASHCNSIIWFWNVVLLVPGYLASSSSTSRGCRPTRPSRTARS